MLDDLVLLRLLAAPKDEGATRSAIHTDLEPYADRAALAAAADRLTREGHVSTHGRGGARLRLTDAGRARVRAAFGVNADKPSGRRVWTWWKERYAMPRALGIEHGAKAEALRVALLRRWYLPELPSAAQADSLAATVDLLLAKRLRPASTGTGALRAAALRAWVADEKPAPTPDAPGGGLPEDLPAFAEQVRAAARQCATGRFGGDKIFISHVWATLLDTRRAAPDEARAFKERLVRANTAGLLRLSRADLAGAHDPRDVQASETPYLGELFHFVRLD